MRFIKKILIVAAIVAALAVVATLLFGVAKKVATRKIVAAVENALPAGYRFDLGDWQAGLDGHVKLLSVGLYATADTLPDRLELGVDELDIWGLKYRKLRRRQGFYADSVVIGKLSLKSVKDRRIAAPQRLKPLFHRVIQRLPIAVNVPRVEVRDGYAEYTEFPAGGGEAGNIYFSGMHLRIDSLTNIAARNSHYVLDASARLMGAGLLRLHGGFPVDSLDEMFTLSGSLGGMPLSALEPMVHPLAHIGIHSGRLKALWFNITGDDRSAMADVRMEYADLKVDILNKQGARSWIGSAAANALVVKPANPMPRQAVREVRARAVRDPYKSNFNYWWRTLFTGVKPSVGLSEEVQQEISSLRATLLKFKQRREQRQAARRNNS